jgi:energy-coupling factor transport system substrate-specific component
MLIPKRIPRKIKRVIYPIICCIHGLAFGILYAPGEALLFGLGLEETVAWIIAGIPMDILHGIGNLFAGILILPLGELIEKLMKRQGMS